MISEVSKNLFISTIPLIPLTVVEFLYVLWVEGRDVFFIVMIGPLLLLGVAVSTFYVVENAKFILQYIYIQCNGLLYQHSED